MKYLLTAEAKRELLRVMYTDQQAVIDAADLDGLYGYMGD
jgi:hypothetical protein